MRRATAARAVYRWTRRPAACCWNTIGLATSANWKTSTTRASVLNAGKPVAADELRRWLIGPADAEPAADRRPTQEAVPVGISLEEMERRLIEATLEHFGGHRAKTAKALGIGLRTLSGKLRQYGYAPREKSFATYRLL